MSEIKIPYVRRIQWAMGGLADNLTTTTVAILVMPIYNIAFGIDAFLLGIIIAIPRILDALSDPLMGYISDNTVSRWGRRRPYIFCGAIVCAIMLPFIWMPLGNTDFQKAMYLLVMYTIYTLAYTVFTIPLTAMGYELTEDYDEKTRIWAWRMYIGLIGSFLAPWLYKLCFHPVFDGDESVGVVFVSIGVSIIILITGLAPAIFVKETIAVVKPHKPIGFLKALKFTFANKSFRLLAIAYICILVCLFIGMSFGLYINIFYICGGSKTEAATISGLGATLGTIVAYISIPIMLKISENFGKIEAMISGLAIALLGALTFWFTLTPTYPYMQLISSCIIGFGLNACWMIVGPMVADICDEDELETGERREGLFGAVVSLVLKFSFAVVAVMSGMLLKLSGYIENEVPTESTLFNMKVLFVSLQVIGCIVGIFLFLKYPLTRKKALEIRRLLKEKAVLQESQ